MANHLNDLSETSPEQEWNPDGPMLCIQGNKLKVHFSDR